MADYLVTNGWLVKVPSQLPGTPWEPIGHVDGLVAVIEAAEALVKWFDDDRCETDQETSHLLDVLTEAVARSVSLDRQETELREEDLRFEHFDVPDQSVIDESGRGVRLTHTPSGVAVSSGAERTQLQNKAMCIKLLRRELAARSVSPDHTGEN